MKTTRRPSRTRDNIKVGFEIGTQGVVLDSSASEQGPVAGSRHSYILALQGNHSIHVSTFLGHCSAKCDVC
jgi:hypothetical protein